MNIRRIQLWSVVVAVLLVPLLLTASFLISSKYVENHRFDSCLNAIPLANRSDPGVSYVLETLSKDDKYAAGSWNINKPYQPSLFNIIVPSGEIAVWPAVCKVPNDIPDCMASPRSRTIICNPKMGEQFESRLLHSGAASIEQDAAMRFVLLTFLGHELGHIEKGSTGRLLHLTRAFRDGDVSCVHHPTHKPSDEEEADNFGSALACRAILNRLSSYQVPTDPAEGLKFVSRLQDELDDSYFLRDDACVGDIDYPSIGGRKHTFSLKFLQCLYPTGWNPVETLEQQDAQSFSSLEQWLEKRQVTGQIGSGSYGQASLYSHTITGLPVPKSFLTFDSTGVDSNLWLVQRDRHGMLKPLPLMTWKSVGRVVNTEQTAQGERLWIWLEHARASNGASLIQVQASCTLKDLSCTSSAAKPLPVPDGFAPFGGDHGSIALVSKDLVSALGRNDKQIEHGLHLKTVEDAAVAVSPDQAVIADRTGGGAYSVAVIRNGISTRRVMMMPPEAGKETLEAIAAEGGRLYLTTDIEPIGGSSSFFLWNCPASILEHSAESPRDDCLRYQAPQEIAHPPALATRDLSSMFDLSLRLPNGCSGVIVAQHRGWLWLVDTTANRQDLIPADGIIRCDLQSGKITTFRARRIDELRLDMQPLRGTQQSVMSLPTVSESASRSEETH